MKLPVFYYVMNMTKDNISNVNNFSYPKNSGNVNSTMASKTESHIVYSFIHERRLKIYLRLCMSPLARHSFIIMIS